MTVRITKKYIYVAFACFALLFYALLKSGNKERHAYEWFFLNGPSQSEILPTLVFEAEWGDEESELGFHNASGHEGDLFHRGFEYFYVVGNKVFIADPVKEQITVFVGSEIQHAYSYPDMVLEGMVASDAYIYTLDSLGVMSRINAITGDLELNRLIIDTSAEPLSHSSLNVYLIGNTIVISDFLAAKHLCITVEQFAEAECELGEGNGSPGEYFYKLPGGHYAILEEYEVAWLHNEKGEWAGVVTGVFQQEYLYLLQGYQIAFNGVYYLVQTIEDAKIYFMPWHR